MTDSSDTNINERVTSLERQVAVVATKVDNLVRELHDFKDEMRASRARQDADMREIREGLNSNVRNMFITVVIAVGAMVVAVLMK